MTDKRIVIVTGSRKVSHPPEPLQLMVRAILEAYRPTTLFHGDARGIDHWAARVIPQWRPTIEVQSFPANRAKWPGAGPVRNQLMADCAGAGQLCVALPGGPGTADMIEKAVNAGIHVIDLRWYPDI